MGDLFVIMNDLNDKLVIVKCKWVNIDIWMNAVPVGTILRVLTSVYETDQYYVTPLVSRHLPAGVKSFYIDPDHVEEFN